MGLSVQYDTYKKIVTGTAGRQKTIEGIMSSAREWFTTTVCTFGNAISGGFVHRGIQADGMVVGLERDKTIGNS